MLRIIADTRNVPHFPLATAHFAFAPLTLIMQLS